MNFEYYYGTQADQFSFIRIPRILLLDEAFSALSLSAKVLYSVLLDRMGLSMKINGLTKKTRCTLSIRSRRYRVTWDSLRKKQWIISQNWRKSD